MRSSLTALVAQALAMLVGCSADSSTVSSPPSSSVPVALASAGTSASASAEPVESASAATPGASGELGAVYLAVHGVGLVRLEGDRAVPVFETTAQVVDLAVGPGGSVFASFYDVGTVRLRGRALSELSRAPYSHFGFRSDDDVWATPDAFEWAVHHFDGKTWRALKKRTDFRGRFDDNKLNDLVVTPDAVWVSSWNGLSRFEGGAWTETDASVEAGAARPPYRMVVVGDRMVGQFDAGWFERTPTGWQKVVWPTARPIRAVSRTGVAVAATEDDRHVVVGPLMVDGRPIVSKPIRAGRIEHAAVDDAGRAWIAGDFALSVVDRSGRVLAEYEPGSLAGVTGRIERVAAFAGGVARLPLKADAPRWELHGRVELYKSGKPLAGAGVTVCAGIGGCDDAPWKLSTTTASDGSFVVLGALPGDLAIEIAVPEGLDDCKTPFTMSPGRSLSVATDCASAKDRRCDVGKIGVCLPFEMPPPR